ncbi:hypothetical protein FO519_002179 [Halicephalobus sp. NKZ332]|nr:hypothetical protein FO519_002179 [Halicephalobus sp. NKZ332]
MIKGSRIALLACGSFNPPTNLHFRMIERAKDFLEVEQGYQVVTGIMSPVADHFGKKDLVSSVHRFRMCELGAASSEWIKPDNWECSREEWTRTLNVLEHHREHVQKVFGTDVRLMLVCGGDLVDSFIRILSNGENLWNLSDIEKMLSEFGLVVLERDGASPKATLAGIPIDAKHLSNVFVIEDPAFPNSVSSTRLREALKLGKSIRFCTPDPVVDYIAENGLYR